MESSYDSHLGFSIVFIIVTCILGWIIRFAIRQLFPDPINQWRILTHEVCCTFEKIACTFELQIVFAENGLLISSTLFILLNSWFNLSWESTKSYMPRHVENLAEGKMTWGRVTSLLCTELLSGLLVYPLCIRPIWQLYDNHLFRRDKLNTPWTVDLQVSPLMGGLVEFGGCFAITFVNKLLRESFRSNIVISIVSALFVTVAIIFGLNKSGAYYNPVLASTIQFGSGGVTLFEHVEIYWIFPILGCFCGYLVFRGAKSVVGRFKDPKSD